MEKRWLIKNTPDEQFVHKLASDLKIDPILASLLLQRGIDDFDKAEQFFRPKLEQLHDPLLMKNMDAAVQRLEKAIQNQERVLLFGDYDVDGTTAVALLWNVLSPHLNEIDYYIPDRYKEGYGISTAGIDFANDNDFTLIIALDCGIKANDKIDYANSLGIDFIICDHHEPGNEIPDAIVLDPKQAGCTYPYKELSGCGVGYKLMEALHKSQQWDTHLLLRQLDLLAVSIAADIVPVTGENRIFCTYGLQLINQQPRPCFQEMLIAAKKELPLTLTNVVFILAPRINAAGRIDEGKKAVKFMISDDRSTLREIAQSIEKDNLERRKLDEEITNQALEMLANDPDHPERKTTLVYQEDWHKGVIGIVASRLIEKHYRPTIVLTQNDGKLTGSARSISAVNIHDVLEACEDHLEQFGGHAFAAGMTLLPEKLDSFRKQFEYEVHRRITQVELVPQQVVDAELNFNVLFQPGENIYEIPKFNRIVQQLEPHGPGNMKPVFVTRNVYVENVVLLKEAHLKMTVSQPNTAIEVQAIGFNMADKLDLTLSDEPLDILYTLEVNVWNNKKTLQLNIKDIRSTI